MPGSITAWRPERSKAKPAALRGAQGFYRVVLTETCPWRRTAAAARSPADADEDRRPVLVCSTMHVPQHCGYTETGGAAGANVTGQQQGAVGCVVQPLCQQPQLC